MHKNLDETDLQILKLLQEDARLDVKQIAALVHKSPSPVHHRVRRLQELGYIKRYMAVVNRDMIGRPLLAVVQVRLQVHTPDANKGFEMEVIAMPMVLVCLQVSGACDFMLYVTATDTADYQRFLDDLFSLPHIGHVETYFILKEMKTDGRYPL